MRRDEQDTLLKRQPNSTSPISILPPELLASILCQCSAIELLDFKASQGSDPTTHKLMPACVRASQVCHDWRAAALGSPEVWSLIHVRTWTPPSLLQYIYDNSKDTLLSLEIDGYCFHPGSNVRYPQLPKALAALLKILRQGAHRLRSLTWTAAIRVLSNIVNELNGVFKHLESFVIVGWPIIMPHTKHDLSGISAPILRRLSITQQALHTSSPLLRLPHLTDVTADFLAESSTLDPFAFLRSARSIRRLTICGLVLLANGRPTQDYGPKLRSLTVNGTAIDLPWLEYFELLSMQVEHGDRWRAILRAVCVPNARVRLPLPIRRITEERYRLMFADLVRTLGLGSHGVLVPQELWISVHEILVWKERAVSSVGRQWRDAPGGSKLLQFMQDTNPWITLPLEAEGEMYSRVSFLGMMLNDHVFWSLSNLKVLHLDSKLSQAIWRTLAELEALEELWVRRGRSGSSSALDLEALSGNDSTTDAPPFPALKVLMCLLPTQHESARDIDVEVTFGPAGDGKRRSSITHGSLRSSWAFALDVRDALVERGQKGASPLLLIEFVDSKDRILSHKLAEFCDVTAKVMWDVTRE